MAELVPIIESGDLKNVVLQNDIQMQAADGVSFEGMHLEIGPSGWLVLNRAIDNDLVDEDTNVGNVALTANTESAAICTVTVTEDIADGRGTYLLTFLYSAQTSPSTVTVRVYVDAFLQTTFTAELEANTAVRTLTYSGTIAGAVTAGQVVTFTVESTIAATISGANHASVLRVVNVRNNDHQLLLNRDDPNVHSHLQTAGYGGIAKTTDTNYGTIGSGAWTTIDNWDGGMVLTPVGVVQDFANSGLRFDAQGVFSLVGTVSVSFNDTNQGRVFGVRLYNQTKGTPGRTVEYFVGRNQDGVNLSQSGILAEIGASEVNDLFQLQIAGVGDSFSNVAVIDAIYSAVKQSGYFG